MAHRINFAEVVPDVPDRWREGWVEIAEYLTVAQRQRIDAAGMAFKLDPDVMREALEALGEGASAKNLTPAQLMRAANLELDLTASEFAEVREAVQAYDLEGDGTVRRIGARFPDELPEALEPVLKAIAAYYEGTRRTPADRKSVGASV